MGEFKAVTPQFFAGLFDAAPADFPKEALEYLAKADTRHREPTKAEVEEYVSQFLGLLKSDFIVRDTEENQAAWLKGWSENLREVLEQGPSAETCKPKYFRGSKFFRLKKDIVVTPNPQLEHDLFVVARRYLFQKYLSKYPSVYELGCGSCGNIWLLGEMFPDKAIKGFDWVQPSVDIANEIGRKTGRNISGGIFDMLNPPTDFKVPEGGAVITVHALEQIGERHGALLRSLIAARPAFVLHYEPIVEYYDEGNVYDHLALWYSQKRKYLSGLVPALKDYEKQGKIKIHFEKRPQLGGVLHEASLVAWSPL